MGKIRVIVNKALSSGIKGRRSRTKTVKNCYAVISQGASLSEAAKSIFCPDGKKISLGRGTNFFQSHTDSVNDYIGTSLSSLATNLLTKV